MDLINFLIEHPEELSNALENERKKNGQIAANRLEAAVDARRRRANRPNVKGIADMIDSGTRAIAGDDYYFGTGVVDQKAPSDDDVSEVARQIRQGTVDILQHPELSPQMAVRFGEVARKAESDKLK